jgi:hypothetical protein
MASEIGLGPTLFLMSTKSLACLFLVITIINLPILIFFYNGTKGESGALLSDGDVTTIFMKLSLGNVG